MPTIFIDADACPVTSEALAVARKNKLPVVIAGNSTQNLKRHVRRGDPQKPTDGFWVDTLPVGVGADAADFAIVQELEPDDIVVTQDIGLAAMVLGRRAKAIGVRGRIYSLATIDSTCICATSRRTCADAAAERKALPPSKTTTANASPRTSNAL